MSEPLVSILIPTFNRAKLLPRCLVSALGQTHKNLRVCVYDDGSTDGTENLVETWQDQRITFKRARKNHGVVYARNRLLDMAEGDFAAWLDSDDVMSKYRIQVLLEAVKRWKAPFARCGYCVFDKNNPRRWKRVPEIRFAPRHAIATSLFRRDCAGQFDSRFQFLGEDRYWELEMVIVHGTGILVPLIMYYIGRGRHGRLTAAQNFGENAEGKQADLKLLREEEKRLYAVCAEMGINGHSRIERVPACALHLPFPIDWQKPENRQLKQLFVDGNKNSSQRWDGTLVG